MTIRNPPLAETFMSIDNAMKLAAQLQTEGHLAGAEEILNRILHTNPTHAYALHLLGVIAHQVGKTPLAIELIQKALMSDANIALFHSNLGEMYRQMRQLELSIECGLRAVKLDPHSVAALSNLGIAYYDAKQYEHAKSAHTRVLALNPSHSNSLNNMGSIYKECKNPEEAARFYKAAIASSPTYVEPLNNLGALLVTEQQFSQAIELLNHAITIAPQFADAHCNLGFAYIGLEHEDQAFSYFKRALELRPQYAEAYIGLAKVYMAKSDLDAACGAALHAIEINSDTAEFYQCVAEIYAELGSTKQALIYFDHALFIDPEASSTLVSKANVLVELGEVDAAERILLKAKDDASKSIELAALCSLVQLRTVKPNDENMQSLLALALKMDHLVPSQQEYLYFSLGKCYEDISEWSIAFEYYTKGCKLKRSRIDYSSDAQTQITNRIIEKFNKSTIARLKASANQSSLPIFVVGMPRSGTTLVEQIIASHPSVHGAGELNYISAIAHQIVDSPKGKLSYPENVVYFTPNDCQAMADEYLTRLTRHAPTAYRITDKMPGNFLLMGLIHALFPNAKIIHVERNPIDTCLSCFTKLFKHGQFFSYDLIELGQYYATYQTIMAHWRRVLPKGAWFDIRYEALISDFESNAKQLIAYCGLEWDDACMNFHQIKRQVRTASLTQVRKPIYASSVERWRRLENELTPLIKTLEASKDKKIDETITSS